MAQPSDGPIEQRGNSAAPQPTPGGDLRQRVELLEAKLAAMERAKRLPDPLQRTFIAQATGSDIAGGVLAMKWQERSINDSGDLVDFSDGRKCTDASDVSGISGIAETEMYAIESRGTADYFYNLIPNGSFHVYLTMTSAIGADDPTYDVFLDAAKTIKIAASISSSTFTTGGGAEEGIACINTGTVILLEAFEGAEIKGDNAWIAARDNADLEDADDPDADTGLFYKIVHLPAPDAAHDLAPVNRKSIVSGWQVDVVDNVVRDLTLTFDSNGHSYGNASIGNTTTLIQAGNPWISVSGNGTGIKVSHADGNGTPAAGAPHGDTNVVQNAQLDISNGTLGLTIFSSKVDSFGHVLGNVSSVFNATSSANVITIDVVVDVVYDASSKTLSKVTRTIQFFGAEALSNETSAILTAVPCTGA